MRPESVEQVKKYAKEILDKITTEATISKTDFWDKTFLTHFEGWDSKMNLNVTEVKQTRMTRRMFFKKLINDNDITQEVIWGNLDIEYKKNFESLSENERPQLERFKRLIVAIRANDPDFPQDELDYAERLLKQ